MREVGQFKCANPKARGLNGEDRRALRTRLAVPVLAELRVWLERERVSVWAQEPIRRGGRLHAVELGGAVQILRRWRPGERHKIDPLAYLRDVLGRVAQHSITKLDELLPANWTPATE